MLIINICRSTQTRLLYAIAIMAAYFSSCSGALCVSGVIGSSSVKERVSDDNVANLLTMRFMLRSSPH